MRSGTDIYRGRDPRSLPLYSLAEASRYVGVPSATLHKWVAGRDFTTKSGSSRRSPAVIRVADPRAHRLSFTNLVEIHVLGILRHQKGVSIQRIRRAIDWMREQLGTEHPLADVDTTTDRTGVYVEAFGALIDASRGQAQIRPVVERYLERIERDENGLAARLFPFTRDPSLEVPKLVAIDPRRRFGRPFLVEGGVETSAIADRWRAGESAIDLAADFGVSPDAIDEALRFESSLRRAA